ncbi:hypothetical protein DL95DRAFT_436832 [Leptodontidium sp. 2 PMI_412]|nr:hypothetical protein DL95DRAFT_436832 [Leptodontidium sp. 2 PMI_412]
MALKLNPFMWDAFIHLCDTGAAIEISNIFKPPPNLLGSNPDPSSSSSNVPDTSSRSIPGSYRSNQTRAKPLSTADPFGTSTRHKFQLNSELSKPFLEPTKIPHGLHFKNITSGDADAPIAQDIGLRTVRDDRSGMSTDAFSRATKTSTRKSRNLGTESIGVHSRTQQILTRKARDLEGPGTSASAVGYKRTTSGQFAHGQIQESSGDAVGTRRSVRLMSQFRPSNISSLGSKGNDREFRIPNAPSLKRPGKSSTSLSTQFESDHTEAVDFETCPESFSFLPSTNRSIPTAPPPAATGCEALFSLLDLFKKFGEGYYLLTHFKCRKALQIFESIPTSQRETGWVLSQMGRAHFEQANYAEAARTFAMARVIAPLCVECMDIYSASLWHLKHDVDLAFLSYELVNLDRLSPQTWCALGNSFSLQRDHSNAIKCFRRATQINPMFAYAFTLEGHEHISNEEYDNAIHAFRKGIVAVKKRHYNAWYGLGIVYQKLGKFDLAEIYFRTASKINPRNPVLIGCIGMALEGRKHLSMALQWYSKACDLAPDSVLVRERKADVLLSLNNIHGASVELAILRDLAPQKASVYVLLGCMYGLAGDKGKAVENYTVALSLNLQASQSIRSDIQSLEDEDEM